MKMDLVRNNGRNETDELGKWKYTMYTQNGPETHPGSNAGIECLKIENKNQEITEEGERNWKRGDIALDYVFLFCMWCM